MTRREVQSLPCTQQTSQTFATKAHASVKIRPRKLIDFPDSVGLARLKEYQLCRSHRNCAPRWMKKPLSLCGENLLRSQCLDSLYTMQGGVQRLMIWTLWNTSLATNPAHTNVLASMTDEERQMMDRYYFIHLWWPWTLASVVFLSYRGNIAKTNPFVRHISLTKLLVKFIVLSPEWFKNCLLSHNVPTSFAYNQILLL